MGAATSNSRKTAPMTHFCECACVCARAASAFLFDAVCVCRISGDFQSLAALDPFEAALEIFPEGT